MSKKPNHLEKMGNIFGTLHKPDVPPSPAPLEASPAPALASSPVVPKRAAGGRPATGKKSDEEYCHTTIYIRKTTRKRVKQILLEAESERDVSDLVEELLIKWLEGRV